MASSYILSKILLATKATLRRRAKTFWGESMEIVLPEPESTVIHRYGIYEPETTAFLLRYLKPGMTFLDIGAHFGYFTLLGARIVGELGQVHSFEPTKKSYEVLRTNTNLKTNIVINNTAVFSHRTTLAFRDFGQTLSGLNSLHEPRLERSVRRGVKETAYRVDALSIDEYVIDKRITPSFVKIDAESAEESILSGMVETIRLHSPVITVEVGDMGVEGVLPSRDLISRVTTVHGYDALEYRGGEIVSHNLRDRYSYGNLLLVPRRD
jgi:FkbM family methyltransferase